MEKFKSLEELTQIDHKHHLLGSISGTIPDLEQIHEYLSKEVLNEEVPDEIKGQFNVAKNMALYTYFFYALAPEVHLKTYTIIEHALRLKVQPKKHVGLRILLSKAVEEGWICDAGFRHIDKNESGNGWCKSMVDIIPNMRNSKAHGSTILVPDCLHHISVCTDFCNQLFPSN
ncbi:hypothetical protein [Marinomonas flavescens]|uniref:hypothetical protein n=1 Tax=Marinomonas flavescens TaxID=2529379 RepID=UPI001054A1E6|nr:hypothetical protein [Marinomonas flavescens]